MTPATFSETWINRIAWIVLAVAVLTTAVLLHLALRLPRVAPVKAVSEHTIRSWPSEAGSLDLDANWRGFQGRDASGPRDAGALSRWLRLAGTFIPLGDGRRKAIIDNLKTGSQVIVGETDRISENIRVLRVHRERIELRGPQGDEQLWLSFSDAGESGGNEQPTNAVAAATSQAGAGAGDGALGMRKVGERSWVFSRESLMAYYNDLTDHPRRLLAVFDSLKPVRNGSGAITGYYLGVEGEQEFFDAVQLREGDIVRSVNSVPMSSRREAEYFIREFAADRVNAFVIEVEREGRLQKMIYQVR